MKFKKILKSWMLPIAMITGVLLYFIYDSIDALDFTHNAVSNAVKIIQPALIFCMLFLSFCKINPKRLRLKKWHAWLLLIQSGSFIALSLPAIFTENMSLKILLETGMICMICPTATAAAVVTGKLGGNTTNLVTYTILINLVTAILAPLFFPLVNSLERHAFLESFYMILKKVFPLLILPLIAALFTRYLLPNVHKIIVRFKDLAFYIWAVSLTLALGVTTKIIVNSSISIILGLEIALISMFCCIFQFTVGKKIGKMYNDCISGGQSMGQKNTIFAIWLSYTFLTPVTAIAGGFYTIWHNLFNSYQLYKKAATYNTDIAKQTTIKQINKMSIKS